MAVSTGLQAAVVTGDRRKALLALSDRLAAEIDESQSPRDIAALSQRLMDVLVQIEGLQGADTGGTPLDELERRRRSREEASRKDLPAREAL